MMYDPNETNLSKIITQIQSHLNGKNDPFLCAGGLLYDGTNDKILVIKKYQDLKLLFQYAYDTIKFTYGITSDNIKKQKHIGTLGLENLNLFDVLDYLHNRRT